MIEGRQRDEWDRTAFLAAVCRSMLDGKIEPGRFNPFADESHRPRHRVMSNEESAAVWASLRMAFAGR